MVSACGRTRTNQLVPGKQLLIFFVGLCHIFSPVVAKTKHCLIVILQMFYMERNTYTIEPIHFTCY